MPWKKYACQIPRCFKSKLNNYFSGQDFLSLESRNEIQISIEKKKQKKEEFWTERIVLSLISAFTPKIHKFKCIFQNKN